MVSRYTIETPRRQGRLDAVLYMSTWERGTRLRKHTLLFRGSRYREVKTSRIISQRLKEWQLGFSAIR